MYHCSSLHFQFVHFSYLLVFETPNEGPEVDEDQNIEPEINDSQNGENDLNDDSGDDEKPISNTARYQKRKLIYQRNIYSVNSALDESNYEGMTIPEQ